MPKPTVSTTFNAKNRMKGPMKRMGKAVKGFAAVAGIALGAAALGMKALIGEASKIENAVAGFTPLLGGVQKAEELVQQLNETAASTPFQFDQIAKAANQLLPVMNQDIEQTVETFRLLGDTAGGNAQKLDSITRGFTKAMLKGKVDLESLNMIAEAGVPIFTELSNEIGVSSKEMFKMVTAGEVTTDQLTNTFKTMTSEGGIFFKGMEIASKTLTGKLSTLKDNLSLTAATIGTQLLPTIKPLLDRAIKIAGAMREWINQNKELINQNIQMVFSNISLAVQTLIKWIRPLVEVIIKVVQELVHMFMETENGQKIIKLLAGSFKLITSAVKIMWAIVKPILTVWLAILEPILDAYIKLIEIANKVTSFAIDKVPGAIEAVKGGIKAALIGKNDNVVRSQSTVTNRSMVDINMQGLPSGSTVNQSGNVRDVNLNYGFQQGNL